MYGYLTLEQCYSLEAQGFAVICDGDKEDCYIRYSEKEYVANNIPQIIDWISDFAINFRKMFAGIFHALGNAFTKLGNDFDNVNKNEET